MLNRLFAKADSQVTVVAGVCLHPGNTSKLLKIKSITNNFHGTSVSTMHRIATTKNGSLGVRLRDNRCPIHVTDDRH